jgi:hypothetical protein
LPENYQAIGAKILRDAARKAEKAVATIKVEHGAKPAADTVDTGAYMEYSELFSPKGNKGANRHTTLTSARRGKWTVAELVYARQLVNYFKQGKLDIPVTSPREPMGRHHGSSGIHRRERRFANFWRFTCAATRTASARSSAESCNCVRGPELPCHFSASFAFTCSVGNEAYVRQKRELPPAPEKQQQIYKLLKHLEASFLASQPRDVQCIMSA